MNAPVQRREDFGYTPEMLADVLAKMEAALGKIYWILFQTGCHPFIEFNGLMHQFVQVCRRASEKGIPFPMANEHTGVPLPVELHDVQYMGEKLRCIFGPIIDSNEEARRALFEALFPGWRP